MLHIDTSETQLVTVQNKHNDVAVWHSSIVHMTNHSPGSALEPLQDTN